MRHFIVLGFASNSQKKDGEQLYLGSDRSEALEVVNTQSAQYARRELYELAISQVKRHRAETVNSDVGKDGMTVAQLKTALDVAGIEYQANAKKAVLIKLLTGE